MVTCVLFLLVLIIVKCEKVDILYTHALLLSFTNSRLSSSSSSSSSSFDLDPLDVSKKSMDETMASLDDLLPAAAKPKREFPENFYDDDPGSEKQPSMKKPGQKGAISQEMRKKLLNESVGLGGVEGKAMPSNLFLNIILFVFALVCVAYVGGVRP
jgi:hypothetical protein